MNDRWLAARAFVRELVADRRSPAVATELLPVVPGEDAAAPITPNDRDRLANVGNCEELAARYPDLLATTDRKQRGTWYTPAALATPTVARTLAPFAARGELSNLRICDPAVGGGTFLLAALRWLVDRGVSARDAARSLHGVDLDSTAAALAALAIHEAGCDPALELSEIQQQVHAGDGLTELAAGTFDAVLTNPPWETLQSTATARLTVARLRPLFRCQGRGKLYTYRLFTERAWQLLRPGGRAGLIVPASIWFDREAEPLRRLLLDECRWEWLYGFENRERLFPIDSRYRFAVVIAELGGRTEHVRCAFGRTSPGEWQAERPRHVRYSRSRITGLSPRHATFVECENERDLAILETMQRDSRPLLGRDGGADGSSDGVLEWRQGDLNMTSDRDRFVLRESAECDGFAATEDGTWRRGDRELLPLYQGAMLFDLHPNTGAHDRGEGHATTWRAPRSLTELRPLYLVDAADWRAGVDARFPARIALRALSNATNERTAAACLLPDVPCGNSLGVLTPRADSPTADRPLRELAAHAALLGSLPFDWALRRRLSGTNLNGFVLADCVVPRLDDATTTRLARLALRLCAILPWHRSLWQAARRERFATADTKPAVDEVRRRELLTEIDCLAGRAFGLTRADVQHIVEDTGPRGFRRVDAALPAIERRPTRWLARWIARSPVHRATEHEPDTTAD
ncbi:MAG: N-6 DNA methylase [bacterium]|nr:N-6 DNA methylase [bacterium]